MKLTVPREEFSELTANLLKQGRSIRFRAFGYSMLPAIHSGDTLRVEPCLTEPSPGEVVFFKSSGGKMMAHRLLSRFEENGEIFYKAKGDFFLIGGCDVFPKKNLVGRVAAVEKRTRFFIRAFQKFQDMPFYRFLARIFYAPFKVECRLSRYEDYEKDQEIIAQLYRYPSYWRTKVHKKPGPVKTRSIAFVGGKPAGIATLTSPGDTIPPFNGFWLWSIFVRTRYRGLGLGKKIVTLLLDFAGKEGAKEVNVLVFEDDQRARHFYEQLQFKPFEDATIRRHLDEVDQKLGRRRISYRSVL